MIPVLLSPLLATAPSVLRHRWVKCVLESITRVHTGLQKAQRIGTCCWLADQHDGRPQKGCDYLAQQKKQQSIDDEEMPFLPQCCESSHKGCSRMGCWTPLSQLQSFSHSTTSFQTRQIKLIGHISQYLIGSSRVPSHMTAVA